MPAATAARGEPIAEFKPRIVVFACNWCSYAGADMAGATIQNEARIQVKDLTVMLAEAL